MSMIYGPTHYIHLFINTNPEFPQWKDLVTASFTYHRALLAPGYEIPEVETLKFTTADGETLSDTHFAVALEQFIRLEQYYIIALGGDTP